MCADSSHGRSILHVALGLVLILLCYVLESLTEAMKPSLSMDKIGKDSAFNVLGQMVYSTDMALTQLLRGWSGQVVKKEAKR